MTIPSTPGTGAARIAVLGAGVIGASWTAHFLARGLNVVAADPAPGAEERLRATVDSYWQLATAQAMAPGASRDRLQFVSRVEDAVADADFVQENGPERVELKQELIRTVDRLLPPEVVIASSSSGLIPSVIQAACERHPERVLVAHPFNPPHLVPLVEVVGGNRTSEAAIERALAFYRSVGKHAVRLRAELPGHLANRLQAALWREAYSLVDRGIASVAEIDEIIAHGPGLRWALLGPFATQALSGGPGGMRHIIDHLGPAMQSFWDDLGAPRLTPELGDAVVAGVEAELAGSDEDHLRREWETSLLQLIKDKSASSTLA